MDASADPRVSAGSRTASPLQRSLQRPAAPTPNAMATNAGGEAADSRPPSASPTRRSPQPRPGTAAARLGARVSPVAASRPSSATARRGVAAERPSTAGSRGASSGGASGSGRSSTRGSGSASARKGGAGTRRRARRSKKRKPCPFLLRKGKHRGRYLEATVEGATLCASQPGAPCTYCVNWLAERVANETARARVIELEKDAVRHETAAEQTRAALEAQLAALQRELTDEQHKGITRKVTLQRLQLQADVMEKERDQLSVDLAASQALAKRLRAEYTHAQGEIGALHSKVLSAKDEAGTAAAELRASKDERARLGREVKELTLFLESANKRRTETDDALQLALASIRELQDAVDNEKNARRADRMAFDDELKRVPAAVYMPSRRRLGVIRSIAERA